MLYDGIIQERLNEIFNEVRDLDNQIQQLQLLRERRIAEHEMLQNIKDKGLYTESKKPTRIHIEDAVKRIFDNAGRPLRIGEIIDTLEEFGYRWSSYQTAYYRLQSLAYLQPTGARGYYNLIR